MRVDIRLTDLLVRVLTGETFFDAGHDDLLPLAFVTSDVEFRAAYILTNHC